MDHSQFYMTAEAYELAALRSKIEGLEKEIRALKGIPEPEPAPPMSMEDILRGACERIFDEAYENKEKA